MEFEDDAFVLAARPHGETGAVVEALTAAHGKWAAHVAGGASRRLKPVLQPGVRAAFRFRSRLADQLGSASLEPSGEGPAAFFDDPLALAALEATTEVLALALPEREPHPGVFLALAQLLAALGQPEIWPPVLVRFEAGLLAELGFALDLSRCAITGATEDLAFVSPRTARAVSAAAGGAYRDRLLRLPPFLLAAQEALSPGDVSDGLRLTGHFLARFVFAGLDRPLPAARTRLAQLLQGR